MGGSFAYYERNRRLEALGFASYDQYLNSPLWKNIRSRVMVQHGHRCRGCGARANNVHHTDYQTHTLQGTVLSGMVPICRKCHEDIEFVNGVKTSLDQANSLLLLKGLKIRRPAQPPPAIIEELRPRFHECECCHRLLKRKAFKVRGSKPTGVCRQCRQRQARKPPAHKVRPIDAQDHRKGACMAKTRSGQPCPHLGDRLTFGVWYCHFHDPNGNFQKNLRK